MIAQGRLDPGLAIKNVNILFDPEFATREANVVASMDVGDAFTLTEYLELVRMKIDTLLAVRLTKDPRDCTRQ